MKIKKLAVLSVVALTALFNISFTLSANAETFKEYIPTYGLYCKDSELIKSGAVKFDLTDTDLLSKGIGVKHSEYKISAANREVEFAIPFISSATNVPAISVSVNGQTVECSVWFGDGEFWLRDEFDIENIYSPILDESTVGTLYTVIPDSDTITVSLKLNERRGFIYETSNSGSSSQTADGSNSWIINNALSKPTYSYFVFGDSAGCTFESSCEYQIKQLTCKEYIDSQYEYYQEYYEYHGGVPVELFYSIANRVLKNNTNIIYDELFTDSINTYRVNAYKFKLPFASECIISYEMPISVQKNFVYEPTIYLVEQKQAVNCNTKYSIELSNEVSYITESSTGTQRNDLSYTAETSEDFYFIFSSSPKPVNTAANTDSGIKRTVLIVCSIIGSVVLIGIVVFIGIMLYRRRANNSAKGENYD